MRKQHEQPASPSPSPNLARPWRLWCARAAVGLVFALNVSCALQFIIWPDSSALAYGLPPTPESAAMAAGMGVAFLMWNVTYPAVIANPLRFKVLYVVVLAQQLVGLLGESLIWWRLVAAGLESGLMAQGIMRFIAFDAAGLVLMLLAFLVLHRPARDASGGAQSARGARGALH